MLFDRIADAMIVVENLLCLVFCTADGKNVDALSCYQVFPEMVDNLSAAAHVVETGNDADNGIIYLGVHWDLKLPRHQNYLPQLLQ